jgi:hypothetical protein
MPRLKKARAGHWYIQTFVHAAGRIATWQIADEGVERIRSLGFEDEEVPGWLFTELRESGLAFTGGSGFNDQAPLDTLPAKGAEKQLKLGITETEQGWILELLVPELPAEIFTQLIRKVNQALLTKCSLRIDGEKDLLPISELWPGKGGKSWPLDPHERPYPIAFVGPWPSDASLKFLTQAVDGLDGKGSLFAASDKLGTRVPRGATVVADNSYYLVLDGKHSQHLRAPATVSVRSIGGNSNWEAWEIRFPVDPDDTVKRWCAQLGVGIEAPKLVLDIVTPPPKRMLVTGVPLLEVGEHVVISATPSTDTVRLDQFAVSIFCEGTLEHEIPQLRRSRAGESVYLKFLLRRTGTYQIRAVKGRVVPITLAVQARAPAAGTERLESTPAPLCVQIGERSYVAFGADLGEERIDVWVRRSEKTPQLDIRCPGLLHLEWSVRGMRERRIANSLEAIELLTGALTLALAAGKAMAMDVDAGSFGRLAFRIAPEALKVGTEGVGEMPASILSRARWLATTVGSLRAGGDAEVHIDAECQRSLRRLGSFRGCGNLKDMVTAPVTVIQHATALGRIVKRWAPLAKESPLPFEGRT